MKSSGLTILSCLIAIFSFSQVYNTEKKILEQSYPTDPRIQVKFISSMRNPGGYEGTTLMVKNLTDKKIYVELKLHITDNCGVTVTRDVRATIKPNGQIGGSTWMGGNEQFDFDSKCASIKYEDWKYSKIKSTALEVVKIEEGDNAGSGGNGNNNGGNGTGGPGPVSGAGGNGNNGGGTISPDCPVQHITVINGPSINCVQLRWFSQTTIQHNQKSGEIKTNQMSDNFVLSYKTATEKYWKEQQLNNYHLSFNLTGLDPCTAYEVRLQRDCGNNMRSDYSTTLRFITGCPAPTSVKADQVKATSAHIVSFFNPGVNACSSKHPAYTIQIEYAAPGGSWQSVISKPGAGSSMLYNLQPNTSYRVRVRFEYGVQLFSSYSNEINFTTPK